MFICSNSSSDPPFPHKQVQTKPTPPQLQIKLSGWKAPFQIVKGEAQSLYTSRVYRCQWEKLHWRQASLQPDLPAPQCLGKSTASGRDDGLVPSSPPRAGHSSRRVDAEISRSPAKPLWLERRRDEGPNLLPVARARTLTLTHTQGGYGCARR